MCVEVGARQLDTVLAHLFGELLYQHTHGGSVWCVVGSVHVQNLGERLILGSADNVADGAKRERSISDVILNANDTFVVCCNAVNVVDNVLLGDGGSASHFLLSLFDVLTWLVAFDTSDITRLLKQVKLCVW